MERKPIIKFNDIRMQFGDSVVHKNISFNVHESEILTILGPSGTGKTVLLKLIIGLLSPTSGSISVLGEDIVDMEEQDLIILRRNIGMLFQGAALFDSLSVFENIAYSLRERGSYTEETIAKIVTEKIEVVGLAGINGIQEKFPPSLSGGQKKRVGLARALASSPKVMLFDEPTTGLDPTATRLISDLIVKLKYDFGITSVVVTHDIESARHISDRWILLDKGLVVADGPVKDLESSNSAVNQFVKGLWKEEAA